MKPKRKQHYVSDSDKPLTSKARSIAPSPDRLLTLDFDQKNTLRAHSEPTNDKSLRHTGHNFIRVTPAASQITYSLISPTRIRLEIEIDPEVIAACEAEDQRQAIKAARTTSELLKWLETECLFERPELEVFRDPDGRYASETAKLEFLSKARKAGLYAGFPTRCDREISTAQFNEWAYEQPEFMAASEKWKQAVNLYEAKLKAPDLKEQMESWCEENRSTPEIFQKIITFARSSSPPHRIQQRLYGQTRKEIPVDAIASAKKIHEDTRNQAIAEVYGLIEA